MEYGFDFELIELEPESDSNELGGECDDVNNFFC